MKYLFFVLVILLTACGGGDPTATATVVEPAHPTGLHSTNTFTTTVETNDYCEIQLAAWPRYYALRYLATQQIAVEVSCNGESVGNGALIICVDIDCKPVSTNLEGYASLSFDPPDGGWSLGEHTWKVEYTDRSPAKVLASKFVVIGD